MRNYFSFILLSSLLFMACGGSNSASQSGGTAASASDYDPSVGIGKYNSSNVTLGASVDTAMAANGEKVFDLKCFACHRLTGEKLVGPGWKGVTSRHTPVWIMNFIMNPDPMIDKDPELQTQLENCLTRMPSQNLNDTEARAILEFMRKNDGAK